MNSSRHGVEGVGLHERKLEEWERIVTTRDWESLPALLADEVTYHNPAQHEPLRGKDALTDTLRLVFGIFEDFEYTRCFSGANGDVLEFKGRVAEVPFTGVDIVRFNEEGKIIELVVMIRPIGAVIKLGEEIAPTLEA